MENPFRKYGKDEPFNAVQEVGRDPLRVPLDTPPENVIDVARALGKARERLMTVLPQPDRTIHRHPQITEAPDIESQIPLATDAEQ